MYKRLLAIIFCLLFFGYDVSVADKAKPLEKSSVPRPMMAAPSQGLPGAPAPPKVSLKRGGFQDLGIVDFSLIP